MYTRTNIHLLNTQIAALKEMAAEQGIPFAELVREILAFYLSFFDEGGPMANVEFVRQEMMKKNDGAEMKYEEVVRQLAYEKAQEYRNRQHNAARITTLVEVVGTNTEELIALRVALTEALDRLTRQIEAMNKKQEGADDDR